MLKLAIGSRTVWTYNSDNKNTHSFHHFPFFSCTTDLRSMTQGRASSSFKFDHYQEVPTNIARELVEKAKA